MTTDELKDMATDIMRLLGTENEHEKIVAILQVLVDNCEDEFHLLHWRDDL